MMYAMGRRLFAAGLLLTLLALPACTQEVRKPDQYRYDAGFGTAAVTITDDERNPSRRQSSDNFFEKTWKGFTGLFTGGK